MNKKDITLFRGTHKLKQKELAELLNMNVKTLSAYERGYNPLPQWFRRKFETLVEEHGINRDLKIGHGGKLTIVGERPARGTYKIKVVEGVSPEQPTEVNQHGGKQSSSPYRLDLIDPIAILAVAKALKEGADKYGEDNWRLINTSDHLNHLLVHVYAYLAGDTSDEHLSHAVCRALFALSTSKEVVKQ